MAYDANGNLTANGSLGYTYDAENRVVQASNGAQLVYDPLGRLFQISSGSGTTQFLYDGDRIAGEYDGGGNLLRRYVHGRDDDDPAFWYEGGDLSNRRLLFADHQGSIVAVSDASGNLVSTNSYDEYGRPGNGNTGRFQYTGQAWIPELSTYYYKARFYSPVLGRFLQTDPIGYADQINLYGYVANDPLNGRDPTGTQDDPLPELDATFSTTSSAAPESNSSPFSFNLSGLFSAFEPAPQAARLEAVTSMPQSPKPCSGPLQGPSTSMMNQATNDALADTNSGATTSPLTSEFSKLNGSPDFSHGWTPVTSIHGSTSYEQAIPGNSGMVVKVYIGDRNFGGANTVTITSPTYSIDHFLGVLPYELGLPVNARNAAVYLSSRGGC